MKTKLILISLFLGFCWTAKSQGFVYKPKNPAFGGESFNYQWLLSSAEAQNLLTEPEDPRDRDENSQLEEFTEGLNSQLLNRINRALLNSQISTDEDLQPGVYNFGSLNVEVYDSTDGLVVNVLDTDTGEQTQIIIPN
jgi:curli production assembly/transport component CsgF